MENNQYTYEEAFQELQEIVLQIESGDINVDDLSIKIQRASELIELCRVKLSDTEENVNKLLTTLQKQLDETEPSESTEEEE